MLCVGELFELDNKPTVASKKVAPPEEGGVTIDDTPLVVNIKRIPFPKFKEDTLPKIQFGLRKAATGD
jgi:hypothetical protein